MAALDKFDWTPERIERCVAWHQQGMTATEISNRLVGPSRNAVIGKLHRLGYKRGLSPRQAQRLSIAAREAAREPRWTPTRERQAVELFTEGMTYSEIAESLGFVTKNAVQKYLNSRGYRHDLSKAARGRMGRIAGQGGKITADGGRKPPRLLGSSEANVPLSESRRVSLLDLRPGVCKWPLGDPLAEDFCFCGADTGGAAMSYCASHQRLSLGEGTPSERAAVKFDKAVL